MKRWVLVAVIVALLASAVPGTVQAAPGGSGSFIVVLREGTDVSGLVADLGVRPDFLYTDGLTGFAATLTDAQRRLLALNPKVRGVVANRTFKLPDRQLGEPVAAAAPAAQVVPTGVRYIHADQSPTARIDGQDQRVDVDVAVLDDGINRHPDLNVAGGFSCLPGHTPFAGMHGTFVGGIIGALDNGSGVVGVAPGARLWSVQVIDDRNVVTEAALLCGLLWVALHAHTIDVANLSLVLPAIPTDRCGLDPILDVDPIHLVACLAEAQGVTIVAGAGNEHVDASAGRPANYNDVLTISALSDFDGHPGGFGAPPLPDCTNGSTGETDDTFATFSNFGRDIDLIAPGVCILSTFRAGGLIYGSGTSFSTPHVAGAAALVKARRPKATPADVRRILLGHAVHRVYPGDPDGIQESTVDAAAL